MEELPATKEDARVAKKRAAGKRAAEAAAKRHTRREKHAWKSAWPDAASKAEHESSGPRQRWLCLAMFGASSVIAVMLGIRLLFALQPGYNDDNPELEDSADPTRWERGRVDTVGDSPVEPKGCGGMCGHLLCSGVVESGGVPAALRLYLNRTWYLTTCATLNEGTRLVIRNSRFPKNRDMDKSDVLHREWLDVRLRVTDLTLADCALKDIADGAFQSAPFARTHALTLEDNGLIALRAGAFEGLHSLKLLIIRRNEGLKFISPLVLLPTAASLRVLTVQSALTHPQSVTNLTGSVTLPHVEHINFDSNEIDSLDSYSFLGLSGVESISLQNCGLQTIGDGVFDTLIHSLHMIRVDNNKLVTLSEEAFHPIVNSSRHISLGLTGNPWNCSCSFAWIQSYSTSWKIEDEETSPMCASPPRNKDISFSDALFCPDDADLASIENDSNEDVHLSLASRVDTTTQNKSLYLFSQTAPQAGGESNEIQMRCWKSLDEQNRKVLFHKNISFSGGLPNSSVSVRDTVENLSFIVTRIGLTSVDISFPMANDERMFYWYPSNATESSIRHLREDMGCEGSLNDSLTITNLQPRQSYVLCAVDETNSDVTAVSQCVSVQTASATGQASAYKIPSGQSVAARGNRGLLYAICVLVFMLAALTLYVAYGFLCRKQTSEETAWREPNWPVVEWPGAKDDTEPKGIFWISGRRKGSLIDPV